MVGNHLDRLDKLDRLSPNLAGNIRLGLDVKIPEIAQTFVVSLATLPAASAPAGLTAARLPVGLKIFGPPFSAPKILTCAKFVERVSPLGWAPHMARGGCTAD